MDVGVRGGAVAMVASHPSPRGRRIDYVRVKLVTPRPGDVGNLPGRRPRGAAGGADVAMGEAGGCAKEPVRAVLDESF